jgi:hypothetical protein
MPSAQPGLCYAAAVRLLVPPRRSLTQEVNIREPFTKLIFTWENVTGSATEPSAASVNRTFAIVAVSAGRSASAMSRPLNVSDTVRPAAAWLFQLNPDNFRSRAEADLYVVQCVERQSAWYVGQNAAKMKVGQRVFVWRSAGKQRRGAGVIGKGIIEETPILRTSFDWERSFEKRRNGKDLRAVLRLTEAFADAGTYLTKERLKDDWILQELKIIRCPRGTNFSLNPAQVRRVERLLERQHPAHPSEIPRPTAKLARISFNSSRWKKPTNEA